LIDPASASVLADQRIHIVDGKIASVALWRDADANLAPLQAARSELAQLR